MPCRSSSAVPARGSSPCAGSCFLELPDVTVSSASLENTVPTQHAFGGWPASQSPFTSAELSSVRFPLGALNNGMKRRWGITFSSCLWQNFGRVLPRVPQQAGSKSELPAPGQRRTSAACPVRVAWPLPCPALPQRGTCVAGCSP